MLALAFGLSPTLQANITVENEHFVVNFLDTENWGQFNQVENMAQVKAGVQGAIDYWGSLLGDNHHPIEGDYPIHHETGLSVPDWERRVVIDFSFGAITSLASTAVTTMIYADENYPATQLAVPNGTSYNKVSRAEFKLKTEGDFPLSLYSDETTDMSIKFAYEGFDGGFSFDGVAGSGYDFQTIFLHEMTHGMGFESDAYGKDGYTGDTNKTAFDASMGSSIGADRGSELAVWNYNKEGTLVKVATLLNPTGGEFSQGEDIVHIDYIDGEEAPLMRSTIRLTDGSQREFTMADLAVLEAMGWKLNTPIADAEIAVDVHSPYKRPFTTTEGGSADRVYSLTGITIAEGMVNDSLTLVLDMSAEQLNLFKLAYTAGNIIGFELLGVSLAEFLASGIDYSDIMLKIGEAEYQVYGVSSITALGGGGSHAIFYIPEPSTSALSLLALGGLLLRRRRFA